ASDVLSSAKYLCISRLNQYVSVQVCNDLSAMSSCLRVIFKHVGGLGTLNILLLAIFER
ncbi:hypothetical protein CWI38_0966p0010, partial [Hamiltosporidium tvaerminnensis]